MTSAETAMNDMREFEKKQFVSVETYRKTAVGVRTPIWFAEHHGEFLMWTDVNSGKAKRIRNNPHVMVAPCTRFGDITGEWIPGQASIDETPEAVKQVETLLRRKIGIGFAIFRLVDKARDGARAAAASASGSASPSRPRCGRRDLGASGHGRVNAGGREPSSSVNPYSWARLATARARPVLAMTCGSLARATTARPVSSGLSASSRL